MVTPKLIRKISDGRIFPYTEALAARKDMVPVWEDGVDPNYELPRVTGLRAEESQQGQLRLALSEKDAAALALQKQLDAMAEENSKLNEEIARLNTLVSNLTAKEKVPGPGEASDPDRMGKIIEGARMIMDENDPNNFTGSGKIRIEPLEGLCGVADVTAAERDAAMEAAK